LAHGFLGDRKASISSAIAHLAHELLRDVNAKAIVAASVSGYTARMVARHRPEKTIYVMTNNNKVHNQLSMVWGVESFVLPDCKTLDELIDISIETMKKRKVTKPKDRLVIVAGRPHVAKEHMSLVKIEEVK
jgi:pyruvate kinase